MRVAVLSVHTSPLASLGGWETGGMNVYVRELSRHLAQLGIETDIFTRRQVPDLADVVEFAPGARVIYLDAGPNRHLDKYDVLDYLPDFACGVQRWRALTGARYDVIHSHYWLSGRLGSLLADHWRVPMVATFHTLAELKNRVAVNAAEREQTVRFEIERRTMQAANRIVAATSVDRAQIERHYHPSAPIDVIPGGVDLLNFRPIPRAEARLAIGATAPKLLLFVGRIQRLKGLEVLIKAYHTLRQHYKDIDAEVVIVGGDSVPSARPTTHEARELARLQRLARRLGVDDRVRFVGAVQQDKLPLYYSAADVTVMPSSYESFGMVAVESLACGTPVVATRVGGLTQIVRDGRTGFLVPWRDGPLFAERLAALLGDDALLAQMREAARPSVLRYGWERSAREHAALYRDVVDERAGASSSRQS